jgi:hypothetical protein
MLQCQNLLHNDRDARCNHNTKERKLRSRTISGIDLDVVEMEDLGCDIFSYEIGRVTLPYSLSLSGSGALIFLALLLDHDANCLVHLVEDPCNSTSMKHDTNHGGKFSRWARLTSRTPTTDSMIGFLDP